MNRMHTHSRTSAVQALIVLLLATAGLAGCASRPAVLHPSTWHMPWRKAGTPPPVIVSELAIQAADGAIAPIVPQYWNRNTLRVDLSAMAGSGMLSLLPSAVNGWPLRIEFTVRPGSMQQLEVSGDKRVVFNVAASGELLLLPLGSGAYTPATKSLTLRWE
jgi:hypothetical protein